MTIHQLVPVNHLNRFPSDILIYVFTHLGLVRHNLPLYMYEFPTIRLVSKYICGIVSPLVFRRLNFACPRLCRMLRSDPAEIADIFERIGQYVRCATISPLDPSSRTTIDASLAAALKKMPNLDTLIVICDPLDTRGHSRVIGALQCLQSLEHITLAEPPHSQCPNGWPIRLGFQEPATQLEEEEEELESSGSGSECAHDTDTGTDTDTEAQIGTQSGTQIGTARPFGVTRNFHSFRKQCLTALLQHHAKRLVSVRLHGSVPLDARNYRLLRDKAVNLHTLHLVGGFESCEPSLVAAVAEEVRWACSSTLRHLTTSGTDSNTTLEARLVCQFRPGVLGYAVDEPSSSVSSGYPNHGTRRD